MLCRMRDVTGCNILWLVFGLGNMDGPTEESVLQFVDEKRIVQPSAGEVIDEALLERMRQTAVKQLAERCRNNKVLIESLQKENIELRTRIISMVFEIGALERKLGISTDAAPSQGAGRADGSRPGPTPVRDRPVEGRKGRR